MILHTIHTLTIGEYARMLNSKDYSILNRTSLPIPQRMLKKRFKSITFTLNELISPEQISRLIAKDRGRIRLAGVLSVQYLALLKLCSLYELTQDKDILETLKDSYKAVFKKEFNEDTSYKYIAQQAKQYSEKYDSRYVNNEPVLNDFEEMLVGLESILAPMDLRGHELYTLKYYTEMAERKYKAETDGRN